jgi:uncharacterized membrane protein
MVSDIDWKSVEMFRGTYLLGNLLLFASCLGSAFYNTYSKRLLETFNPVELLVYTFLVASIELLILMLILEPPNIGQLLSLGLGVWTTLLTIALFSLSISMLLFFWVIDKIDVTQASLSIYLLPVFGVLLSTVFVGEKITTPLVFGGLLVFIGTFLVTVYEERKRLAPPQAVSRGDNGKSQIEIENSTAGSCRCDRIGPHGHQHHDVPVGRGHPVVGIDKGPASRRKVRRNALALLREMRREKLLTKTPPV